MHTFLKIMSFFAVNVIGFFIGSFIYVLAIKFNAIDINAEDFNPSVLQFDLVVAPAMSWFVCFLFSFAYFFLKGQWKKVFLFAPVVVPFLHAGVNLIIHM